eukprot:IDg12744t1
MTLAAPPAPLPHRETSSETAVSHATIAAPPEDDDHNVYSSVSDFSDNHDFYDPSDASLLHVDDDSHSADEHQLTAGRELSDEYEFDDDDGDVAAGAGAHEELVRRNSNFPRLSAHSCRARSRKSRAQVPDVRPDNLLRSVNGTIKRNPLGCITHVFTEVRSMSALVRARLAGASPAFLVPELCWQGNAP